MATGAVVFSATALQTGCESDLSGNGFNPNSSAAAIAGASTILFSCISVYQQEKPMYASKGNLGIDDVTNPVSSEHINDEFLGKAQKEWYPGAEMDKVDEFTVDNVTNEFDPEPTAYGRTKAVHPNGQLNGHSKVYFNRNTTFSSYKRLFYTMGHELVHVSQISALNGMSWLKYNNRDLLGMLDVHAWQYNHYLGDPKAKGTPDIGYFMNKYGDLYNQMSYTNFNWTFKANYQYPFK